MNQLQPHNPAVRRDERCLLLEQMGALVVQTAILDRRSHDLDRRLHALLAERREIARQMAALLQEHQDVLRRFWDL